LPASQKFKKQRYNVILSDNLLHVLFMSVGPVGVSLFLALMAAAASLGRGRVQAWYDRSAPSCITLNIAYFSIVICNYLAKVLQYGRVVALFHQHPFEFALACAIGSGPSIFWASGVAADITSTSTNC
jgi:hypothetical protein